MLPAVPVTSGTGRGDGAGDAAVDLLTAVADPSRLAILRILAAGARCVCNLQSEVAIPANLLSYHLKVLREAGLIYGVRRGRWIDYHLAPDAAHRLHAALPMSCPAEADAHAREQDTPARGPGCATAEVATPTPAHREHAPGGGSVEEAHHPSLIEGTRT